MDQVNDTPSPGDMKPDDSADSVRGGSMLKESFLLASAFLTAVLAVGGGIFVLTRDTGKPRASSDAPVVGSAGPASPAGAPRANAATIFRCEVNGKTVYADVPCSNRDNHPVDVFVNEGFQPTDTSTLMGRKLARDEPAPVASASESARSEHCDRLDEAIRQNEQTARLPESGQMRDSLAQQRRKLIDEKHGVGC